MSAAELAAGAAAFLAVAALGGLGPGLPVALMARRRGRIAPGALLSWLRSTLDGLGLLRRLRPPDELRKRLTAAGDPGGLGVREWMTIKLGCAALISLPAVQVAAGGSVRLGTLLALAAPLAGFVLPDYWLARLVRSRLEDARRRLPDLLDLMRVSVEAGVPPMRALHEVSACFDGVLALECRRTAATAALGEPQDAALARLADRLPADEIRSFADAMRRARRHGLPLGRTLAMQASRARQARSREIEERAARAGPKIQLVVALLLVPSMLLMVAAVLASELLSPGLGLSY